MKALNDKLKEIQLKEAMLYEIQLDAVIKLLTSEDVKAADITAARQFMKEHGIEGSRTKAPLENNGLHVVSLPEFEKEGELDDNGFRDEPYGDIATGT